MLLVVLALRGTAAIAVLAIFAGGLPRLAQAGLAITFGLWSALLVMPFRALEPSLVVALGELAIGAALGVIAAMPLLAAQTAGRFVDRVAGRDSATFGAFFGLLAAAVFVGIDGHVTMLAALVESHRDPVTGVMPALATLVPIAVRLAVPWLVTAAVVELAIGAGTRLAARSSANIPAAVAVPSALVMMTASLVATLAIAIAAGIRAAL